MEHVSNEEKIQELLSGHCWDSKPYLIGMDRLGVEDVMERFAEWKDEQFLKEKKEIDEQHAQVRRNIRNLSKEWAKIQERILIDRAVDFISKRFYIGINNQVTSKGNYDTLTELIKDLTNSMKGE